MSYIIWSKRKGSIWPFRAVNAKTAFQTLKLSEAEIKTKVVAKQLIAELRLYNPNGIFLLKKVKLIKHKRSKNL